jgi:hypothetical protein
MNDSAHHHALNSRNSLPSPADKGGAGPTTLVCAAAGALCLGAAVFLASCGVVQVDYSKPADVERLYNRKCGSCHTVVGRAEHTAAEWVEIMEEMGPMAHLTPAEHEAIESWLLADAKR